MPAAEPTELPLLHAVGEDGHHELFAQLRRRLWVEVPALDRDKLGFVQCERFRDFASKIPFHRPPVTWLFLRRSQVCTVTLLPGRQSSPCHGKEWIKAEAEFCSAPPLCPSPRKLPWRVFPVVSRRDPHNPQHRSPMRIAVPVLSKVEAIFGIPDVLILLWFVANRC